MTSPIIYKNRLFIASVDENLSGKAHVYALDSSNGKILWKFKVKNSIKNSIAAQNNLVFAQDMEGNLYALHADTGELVWERKLTLKGLPVLVEGLVVSGDVVYAGTGKGLIAIDSKSGKEIWTNEDWSQGEGATTTLAVSQNSLISGTQWGALYANDLKAGKLRWKHNTGSPVLSTVSISGNTLFATDFSGNVYAFVSE